MNFGEFQILATARKFEPSAVTADELACAITPTYPPPRGTAQGYGAKCRALVRRGLLTATPAGYSKHDFNFYNLTPKGRAIVDA